MYYGQNPGLGTGPQQWTSQPESPALIQHQALFCCNFATDQLQEQHRELRLTLDQDSPIVFILSHAEEFFLLMLNFAELS